VTAREEVAAKLRQQFFPVQLFEEHLTAHLLDYFGQRIRDVERIYREMLGYPIAVHETTIRDALWSLCLQKQIGIKHEKDSACGRKPQLTDAELTDALVTEPFPDSKLRLSSELPKLAVQQQSGGHVISSPGEPKTVGGIEVESEKPTMDLETPFCHGVGDLRQEVAMLLVEHE